jgi:Kef-type K+ transport system membrane component KefB
MIRRIAALIVVLAVETLVQRAVPEGGVPGGSVALAIGFVLVAAVLTADFAELVSLPRVTGYMALGLLCGPYVGSLITRTMATDLAVFNGLAVVLIAFMAGLEINVMSLRSRLGTVLRLGAVTLAVMYVVILAALYAAWPWLTIAPEAPTLTRLAIAVVLTVMLISFSPTVTIAVIAESRARGPFTELVLTLVVLTDLALILAFTLAMQFAGWTLGATGHDDVGLAAHLAWEIFGSLAFGAAIGSLFALYLRFVGRELTLALLGLCGAIAVVAGRMSFEPLLTALAAGLVVENIAPPRGDALRIAVEKGALPVLVVFFAAAGASLQIDALAELGVVAVAIALLRAIMVRVGTAAAAKASGVDPEHGGLVWMGLISQAGVTLGLTSIVAARYPDWGGRIQTLVVAIIAIHQVIGPVLFRAALAKMNEIGRMDAQQAQPVEGAL